MNVYQVAPVDRLDMLLAVVLGSGLLFGVFSGVMFLTADSVDCGTFLGVVPYCSGTYQTGEIEVNKTVHRNISEYRSTTCFRNGQNVNCTEDFLDTNKKYYKEFDGGNP